MLADNYKTCRKYSQYKDEIQNKIEEIEKTDNLMIESRMDAFLNSGRIIPSDMELDAEGEGIQPINPEIEPAQNIEQNSDTQPAQQQTQTNNSEDELIQPYLQ